MEFSRRQFLGSAAAMSAATALGHEPKAQEGAKPIASSGKAVIITKFTGMQSIDGAYEMLRRGQCRCGRSGPMANKSRSPSMTEPSVWRT